jgi:hypothetical protein
VEEGEGAAARGGDAIDGHGARWLTVLKRGRALHGGGVTEREVKEGKGVAGAPVNLNCPD